MNESNPPDGPAPGPFPLPAVPATSSMPPPVPASALSGAASSHPAVLSSNRSDDDAVPAIEVRNLSKVFGGLKAVDNLSFKVMPGQVVGFVGANGAGKTTTMRILASLEMPTRGTAKICGIDVVDRPYEIRKLLGWMPDAYGTYAHMTVVEYLDFFARALGYSGKECHDRVEEVMDFADLTPIADRFMDKLSKGMGQRLCLGRTLIHEPPVLILDEPAAGLDPKARVELKHLIRLLAEEGRTIFISSHILTELGEMCDSLLFVDKGRIVRHGTAQELMKGGKVGVTTYLVETSGDPLALESWATMAPDVQPTEVLKRGVRIEIPTEDTEVITLVLKRMLNEGIPVTEFRREERRLEDVFVETLGSLEEGAQN